jgi:hypothetical protein
MNIVGSACDFGSPVYNVVNILAHTCNICLIFVYSEYISLGYY